MDLAPGPVLRPLAVCRHYRRALVPHRTHNEYHFAMKALATHDYSVAQGIVTDFVPMLPGGLSLNDFVVRLQRF
jgi:hypothetical protein